MKVFENGKTQGIGKCLWETGAEYLLCFLSFLRLIFMFKPFPFLMGLN